VASYCRDKKLLTKGETMSKYIFFFMIIFISISANAATYYVRTDGNDSCNGLYDAAGSKGNCAWSTLQHAADTVVAGDTINVRDGSYVGFMIQTAGKEGSPITFKAQGTSANITSKNSKTNDGINIESYGDYPPDYITIDGFNVYGIGRMGIRAIAGTGIIIKNCTIYNNGDCGILTGSTPHIYLLNNTLHNNGSIITQHNIYVSNAGSDYPTIRGNVVYSAGGGSGIQLNGDWLEGGDGYIDYALIEDNVIYTNAAKGISGISIRYATIQNNVFYNQISGAAGVHLVDQQGSHYSINNVVVNNTFIEPNIACVRVNDGSTGNIIFNNICVGSTGIVFEGSGNYQSNNYIASSAGTLFVNAGSHDYNLASGSKAIGYGLTSYQSVSAPSIDKEGNARTIPYDAGAYEYGSTIEVPGAPHLYPIQ
jgi:hypothetical protein